MAAYDSTTLARRNRSPFVEYALVERDTPPQVAQRYVQSGELFHNAPDELVLDCARHVIAQHFRPGAPLLNHPQLVRDFLSLQIGTRDHEVFAIILLDSRNRLIDYVELFHGTVDGAAVYMRVVVECVVARGAVAVILVHNHPSGNPEPSLADMGLTERIRKALALIEVKVVDHLIVGETIVSMFERGMVR